MDPWLWGVIGIVALLVLRGYFSTARVALGSVRRQSLRDQVEEGSHRAEVALAVAEDSSRVLITFRIASLLADFLLAGLVALLAIPPLGAWLADAAGMDLGLAEAIGGALVLPLAGLLAFALAETLPETMVQADPLTWATRLAGAARLTEVLLSPAVAIVAALQRSLTGQSEGLGLVTEEEIMTLIDAGEEEGSIEQEEKEMIYSILQLDETLAREIMVPRIDIVALETTTPFDEALALIIEAGHSRIPVYEESLDHIKGMLYAKDLLEIWHNDQDGFDLLSMLRPALFIPESKRVSDLLHELQSAQVHIAIVIDEYGGTAGLVTIEDIVEEIVGEIFDEYDEAVDAAYEPIGEDEYVFDARIDLDDFNRLLDVNLPTELGDTLGGYIYGRLGKVPEPGEVVTSDRVEITVLEVLDRRIRKVGVKLIRPQAAAEESEHNHHVRNADGR